MFLEMTPSNGYPGPFPPASIFPAYALVPLHQLIPPPPLPSPAAPSGKPSVQLRIIEEKPQTLSHFSPSIPPPVPDFSVPPPPIYPMDAPRNCPPPIAAPDSAFLASLLANIPEEIRQRPPSQTPAKPRQSPMARLLHNREVRENEELVKVPEEKKRLKLSRSSLIMGKVVTYQNGINGSGRSDYEKTANIPIFTSEAMEEERKICEAIFDILRQHTDMSLTMLYREVVKNEELGFEDEKQLQVFLEARPHLFEMTWKWGTVKNRSFGYRRGMVYLSCLILNNESSNPNGAKLTAIFDEAASLPTYHPDDVWADDYLWIKQLEKMDFFAFLRRNSAIYQLTVKNPKNGFNTAYVKIKPSAKEIPSLWDSTLLPGVMDYHQRLDGQFFFDKSRSIYTVGFVNHSCDKYARIIISEGLFIGRTVFVEPSVAKIGDQKLSTAFPHNSQVAIGAYFALFSREHFRCSAIRAENIIKNDVYGPSYDIVLEEE